MGKGMGKVCTQGGRAPVLIEVLDHQFRLRPKRPKCHGIRIRRGDGRKEGALVILSPCAKLWRFGTPMLDLCCLQEGNAGMTHSRASSIQAKTILQM